MKTGLNILWFLLGGWALGLIWYLAAIVMTLSITGLPWARELHLKNTDAMYDKTFGFRADERKKGIVDVAAVRTWLQSKASLLPVKSIIGYLEIGGPKLGRLLLADV